ncbi:MAG: site-2 protease family protein [Firmicutes bacterium]|nr:site-2 protease family protein [Bacillota bacterium]
MFSLLDMLFQDPLRFFEYSLYRVPAVLIALVLHEWAHGYVAFRLGDPTAKMMNRLSINPLRHLDPVGALLMFFFGFGWARPVPVNPNYFKKPHRDDFLVSIAGITMNLCLFLAFTVLAAALNNALWHPQILRAYSLREMLGVKDGFINYILAGYGTEWSEFYANPGILWAVRLTSQIAMVNLYIAIFNLLPIPPLDGSHVLNDLILKKDNLYVSRQMANAGMAAVLILSYTGVLGKVMLFLANGVQSAVLVIVGALMGS